MGLLETMLLAERPEIEGDIERQLNNVIDRGLESYIRFLATRKIAGSLLDLDEPGSDLVSGITLEPGGDTVIESILAAGPRALGKLVGKARYFL